MNLSKEIIRLAKEKGTSLDGFIALGDYYIRHLGWSEKQANDYMITLFYDGTIDAINVLNGKEGK